MVMMHDFNVTENYVIFMDLPVCFDLSRSRRACRSSSTATPALASASCPRHGTNADIRWFEIDPCYVFHPVNAHEDGDTLVLHVSRQPEAFGSSNDDYAQVGRLWRWTIDLAAGTVSSSRSTIGRATSGASTIGSSGSTRDTAT